MTNNKRSNCTASNRDALVRPAIPPYGQPISLGLTNKNGALRTHSEDMLIGKVAWGEIVIFDNLFESRDLRARPWYLY